MGCFSGFDIISYKCFKYLKYNENNDLVEEESYYYSLNIPDTLLVDYIYEIDEYKPGLASKIKIEDDFSILKYNLYFKKIKFLVALKP